MGVGGGLWDVLKPCAREEGGDYLRGRRVAVDLSVWVVASLRVPARRPHLRTTFFRTLSLFAAMGASPVFVLDGPPSPLKARYFRSSSSSSSPAPSCSRNAGFLRCVSECVELLRHLGMPVLCASGEAEALCAQLNREGHVHACLTPDSDAFLLGARTVITALRPAGHSIQCFHMADIHSALGLTRHHMLAMALLLGCDHHRHGVRGVGIATALRFVKSFNQHNLLDKLREIGRGMYDASNGWQANVCRKLAAHTDFPNEDIISLYLRSDHNHDLDAAQNALRWDEPDVDALVDFLGYTLNWLPSYVRTHMLPMLSTIHLRGRAAALSSSDSSKSHAPPPTLLQLGHRRYYEFHSIQRVKVRHGRPRYLVRWINRDDDDLRPSAHHVLVFAHKQLKVDRGKVAVSDDDEPPQAAEDDDDRSMFVVTEEDIQLVSAAFPDEARRFQEQDQRRLREEKSRPPRKKRKLNDDLAN